MLHPNFYSRSNQQALSFLEQNPSLSHTLLAECEHDLDKVTTLIEPVLLAAKRCEISSNYIQAVTWGQTTFLATNLCQKQTVKVTDIASNWLMGRNPTCAIFIPNNSVSRRHAVIGYCAGSGFYITDVGSTNGIRVNRHKVARLERCLLRDGDLIELGSVQIEFFVSGQDAAPNLPVASDVTYC